MSSPERIDDLLQKIEGVTAKFTDLHAVEIVLSLITVAVNGIMYNTSKEEFDEAFINLVKKCLDAKDVSDN